MSLPTRTPKHPDGTDGADDGPAVSPAETAAVETAAAETLAEETTAAESPPPESPAVVERQGRRGTKTAREIELERRLAELEDENHNLKTVLAPPKPKAAPARRTITDEVAAFMRGED